ncbi:hypothetical protein F0562_019514 [Nyssa sinensis]|uniref:Uncharacterized protein n=1 Tax=Nyssa sinensis TaxID=561372 RepID=A0A5J5BSR2_9ASTE|nr:hypothetical protein F0562_019514 [Nyssa sinensis]
MGLYLGRTWDNWRVVVRKERHKFGQNVWVAREANEIMEQIDWDLNFFNFDEDPSLLLDLPFDGSVNEFSNLTPFSINEFEYLLMKDDDYDNRNIIVEQSIIPNNCFSVILLDSPVGSDESIEIVDLSDDKNSFSSEEVDVLPIKENKGSGGDPISKKRKRLLVETIRFNRSRISSP